MRKYLSPNIKIMENGDDIPLEINLNDGANQGQSPLSLAETWEMPK